MNSNYKEMSIEDFAQILMENPGKQYAYSYDVDEYNHGNNTMLGWFGAMVFNLFDVTLPMLAIGYFGDDTMATVNSAVDCTEDVIRSILYAAEFSAQWEYTSEIKTVIVDTMPEEVFKR